jgi:hypothetical protein
LPDVLCSASDTHATTRITATFQSVRPAAPAGRTVSASIARHWLMVSAATPRQNQLLRQRQ